MIHRWIGIFLLLLTVGCSPKVGHPKDCGYVSKGASGQGQRFVAITFIPGDGQIRSVEEITVNEVPLSFVWEKGTSASLETFLLIDVRSETGMMVDSTYYPLFIAEEYELELKYSNGNVQEIELELYEGEERF